LAVSAAGRPGLGCGTKLCTPCNRGSWR
jgi:hypothetical protein